MCFSSASIRSSPSTYPVAPTCASNHVNDLALGTSPPQPVSSPCARLSVGSGGVSQTAIIWVLVCVLRGGGRGAHFDVPLVDVCERFHRLSRWTWPRLPVLDLRVVAPWAQRRQRDKWRRQREPLSQHRLPGWDSEKKKKKEKTHYVTAPATSRRGPTKTHQPANLHRQTASTLGASSWPLGWRPLQNAYSFSSPSPRLRARRLPARS